MNAPRAGRRLMIGIPGRTADREAVERIARTGAGGVVLFRRNASSAEQVRALVAGLRAATPWPLIVAIDQEGGAVLRLERGVTVFPGNMALGASDDADLARRQGHVSGVELAGIGIDLNLAPVVDLQARPDRAVLGVRSFGADPARVAKLATALVRGHAEAGVRCCLKHFPGLGAASLDPHERVATFDGARSEIDLHLGVFAAVLESLGALEVAMMTTHLALPGLDPSHIATASRAIVSGLLRETLGFRGAVLTDDLEMGGALAAGEVGAVAVAAARAGHDLLLVCHDFERQMRAAAALAEALASGQLDAGEHVLALQRVARLARDDSRSPARDASARPTRDASPGRAREPGGPGAVPSRPEPGDALARRIARAAVHRFASTAAAPDLLASPPRLLLPHPSSMVEVEELDAAGFADRAAVAFARGGLALRELRTFDPADPDLDVARLLEGTDDAPLLLGSWEARRLEGMRRLLAASLARPRPRGRELVVLHLRNPLDQALVPDRVAAFTAFGWRDVQLEALAAVLTGRCAAAGILPVPMRTMR